MTESAEISLAAMLVIGILAIMAYAMTRDRDDGDEDEE